MYYFFTVRYNAEEMSIDKICLMSAILLNGQYACMVTKWMWLNATTFVFPQVIKATEDVNLVYVTLNQDNKQFSISTRSITFLKNFVMNTSINFGYINFWGNFFTFPRNDEQSSTVPYFYFLTHCPQPHRHARLLIISQQDLKIVRYIDLPGDVVEIVLDAEEREMFLAISVTKKFEFFDGGSHYNVTRDTSLHRASHYYHAFVSSSSFVVVVTSCDFALRLRGVARVDVARFCARSCFARYTSSNIMRTSCARDCVNTHDVLCTCSSR